MIDPTGPLHPEDPRGIIVVFGVTTAKCHLNQLDGMYPPDPAQGVPGFAAELEALDAKTESNREINNWFVFAPFAVAPGQPAFAGRYFSGQPTKDDVDTHEAFCLWAHGEGGGTDVEIPKKIFPIQRANAKWQAATGSDARTLARLEAKATLDHIVASLRVRDLWIQNSTKPKVVYLEAAPGKLSGHYWRHWANFVLSFEFDDPFEGRIAPFVPGIICDFEARDPEGDYWPEEAVRNALGAVGIEDPNGPNHPRDETTKRYLLQPDCFSLWARKMPRDAEIVPLFAIEWFNSQTEVPIHFVRVWDGNVDPIPDNDPGLTEDEELHIPLVTLDLVREEITEDMTDYALDVFDFYKIHGPAPTDANWHNSPIEISTKPNMIGLDHIAGHGQAVYALASQTLVNLHLVPDANRGTDYSAHPIELPPVFTGRYLEPRGNGGMTPQEARGIAAGNLDIVSIYQQAADPTGTNDPPPGEPGGNRMTDASIRRAFENAMAAGQPAFTPIYFAMDVDVDGENHQPSEWRIIPGEGGAADTVIKDGPSFRAAFDFYRRVRSVYVNDYITKPGAVPYYIGAYGPYKLLHALYRAGLVTHFWLIAAWTFGRPIGTQDNQAASDQWFFTSPGLRAWPHANIWQIRLASAGTHGFWDRTDLNNSPPFPGPNDPEIEVSWCDINVAWGNPAGWRPVEQKIPVLPDEPEDMP